MSRRAILCTAIGVAALTVGGSMEASAATVTHNAPARVNTTVRTNTRVNTVRTPQIKTTTIKTNTIKTNTNTTQFRKLNTGGTGTGSSGAKFHKPITGTNTLHVTPATLKVNPNLKLSPAVKLGPSKFNPAVLQQNKFAFVKLNNNKFAPVWKQKHGLWWGGKWKYFVPFTALGAVLIGGSYYYPDAYVGFARPYCTGLTPDGCQLNWQQVNFEDGGADWQCVQFCPRPGAMPPPQAAALVAPPPVPQGSCEVTIFSDANFGGTGVTTGEEQPQLSQSGWQNQIASIQVKSGTWDFFTDENFTGAPMRLQPGPYQDLGPEWTKKIGSFMCVQPGS
jgi:Beta/Gamma crystallin